MEIRYGQSGLDGLGLADPSRRNEMRGFVPQEGENLLKILEGDIRRAGLMDDIPGPGVLLCLKPNEVCQTYSRGQADRSRL
jgi:hypothetical protein